MSSGKKMVEYLAQNKTNQHSELVLEFGVEVAQNKPSELTDVANAALELKLVISLQLRHHRRQQDHASSPSRCLRQVRRNLWPR